MVERYGSLCLNVWGKHADCYHKKLRGFNAVKWRFQPRAAINDYWLVVWTPLKNISQLGWLFPIYGKIKNVPNHRPDYLSNAPICWALNMKSTPIIPGIHHKNPTAITEPLRVFFTSQASYFQISWNRGTPSHHPFIDRIFLSQPSSYGGYPHDYGNPHMCMYIYIYIIIISH